MIAKVVGVSFANDEYGINRQEVIRNFCGEEKIFLKREPNNKFDKNAVAVMTIYEGEPFKIGYLRAELAGIVSEFWNDFKFFARIKEIKPGSGTVPWGLLILISKTKKRKDFKKKPEKREERK